MNIQSVLEFILRKQRNSHTFIFFKIFKEQETKYTCKYNIYAYKYANVMQTWQEIVRLLK